MATNDASIDARWSRAIVGTNSEYHSLTRLVGKLADGIIFKKIVHKETFSELKDELGLPEDANGNKYQLLLLIREDVFSDSSKRSKFNRNAYFYLLKQISTFIRITVDSEAFIAKSYRFEQTLTGFNDLLWRNNNYSDHWPKLQDSYEANKTTYMLFSAATVTDRTDVIFNVMNSVISLESLLLNGESAENAYKFRMRGAYLLSSSPEERALVYVFLKYVYELRSAVVHSNDKLRRKIRLKLKEEFGFTIFEANSELIKMNRFILKQFLSNPEILTRLDEIILYGKYDGESYANTHMKEKIKARKKTFNDLRRKAEHEKLRSLLRTRATSGS